jgi:integrase
VGELSKAQWKHINLDAKTWLIPDINSKNEKPHTIYLSEFAARQFELLAENRHSNNWIFPNRDLTSHVSDKSIAKQINGRQNPIILKNRTQHNTALMLSGGKWTPHDLRRTGATLMGDLGVLPHVIEKCLNHTEQNKMKRIYQRQELKLEQADAWRQLGDLLVQLSRTDPENLA